eukprot:gene19593-53587_t
MTMIVITPLRFEEGRDELLRVISILTDGSAFARTMKGRRVVPGPPADALAPYVDQLVRM